MAYIGKVTDTAGNTHLVGSTLYGTCDTGASTAAKVVTCSNFSKLETGVTIHVKFTNAQSAASPTLNVNSTGAKSIKGGAMWFAGTVCSFTYDGTDWVRNDYYYTDTKNTTGTYPSTDLLYLVGVTASGRTDAGGITNSATNVTVQNGGLSCSTINTGNGAYEVNEAAAKAVDTSISSTSSTNLPTSAAVAAYVASAVTGASEYKGPVSAESTLLNQALTKGWYYIVAMPDAQTSSITIGGKTCEAGDMVWIRDSGTYTTSSSLGDHIDIIQSNIDTLTNPEITTIWNNAVPVS